MFFCFHSPTQGSYFMAALSTAALTNSKPQTTKTLGNSCCTQDNNKRNTKYVVKCVDFFHILDIAWSMLAH